MRRFSLCLLILPIVHCARCPEGYELVRDGECRGFAARKNLPWQGGVDIVIETCREVGAQPVIIHGEEQESYWALRADSSSKGYLPTGIVCNTSSKQWQWANGSPVDYKPPEFAAGLDSGCAPANTWDIHNDGRWGCGGAINNNLGSDDMDIFCTKQLLSPVDSGCDSDDGVCYEIGATAESWQDAQMICAKLGSNLASVHNQQQNSFIRRLAVSKGAVNGLFLGATISGKGRDFGWIDGSAWDYANFYPGFPKPEIGDCLAMDTTTTLGQWMNFNCSGKLPTVCVRNKRAIDDPSCSTETPPENRILTSPGFPYNASIPCEFFLEVEEGKMIELEIIELEANSCCDFLVIHDGFLGGTLIANLTSVVQDTTYTSTSNMMRVSWQPNGAVNVMGLAMIFRAV